MGIGKTTISQCSAYENIIFCWVMHEQSIIDQLLQTLSMLELYSAMSKTTSDTMIFQNSFPENSASENRTFHDVSSESC